MKKILMTFLLFLWIGCLAGCRQPGEPEALLPENAVALTIDNFADYFDIKVVTDCEYDLSAGQTVATSYVAFVLKDNCDAISGEVSFDIHCGIYTPDAPSEIIPVQETRQTLALKSEITNGQYSRCIHIEQGYGYQADPEKNAVTLCAVSGYVVPAAPEPNAYETLTEADRAASAEILAELQRKMADYGEDFSSARNYYYASSFQWQFLSVYGGDRNIYSADNGEDIRRIDLENQRFAQGKCQYFVRNDQVYQQYENELGLVVRAKSDLVLEDFLQASTPRFDEILDADAVYLRQGKGYCALTTLQNMPEGPLKQRLVGKLEEVGVTGDPEAFVVKYSYEFTGRNFAFCVEVFYRGDAQQSQYVDNYICYGWEVADLNMAKVELWPPDEGIFALELTLEDAMVYKTGLVRISEFSRKVDFTVFQMVSSAPGVQVDNFLPVEVLTGGLYTFRLSNGIRTTIYNAEGQVHSGMYYPEGIYYLQCSGVPYGKTPVIMQLGVTPLADYGDLFAPIPIAGAQFQVNLEKMGDMQAFRFEPAATGIYELSACDTPVQVYLYDADAPQQILASCRPPYMTMYLEAGKAYVLAIQQYPSEDGPLTWDVTVDHIGDPPKAPQMVDGQWRDILLAGTEGMLYVDVAEVGAYVLELERVAGLESLYGYFCDEEGTPVRVEKMLLEDGTEAYVLGPGRYYFCCSAAQYYFKGRIRLVPVDTEK